MALMPKRVKYRKLQRGNWSKGKATRGTSLSFGDYGLVALEHGLITAQQMETIRLMSTRFLGTAARIYIRMRPWKSMTAKPQETGLGMGKGDIKYWCSPVKPGKIIIEIAGADDILSRQCLRRVADKLPVKTRLVTRKMMT